MSDSSEQTNLALIESALALQKQIQQIRETNNTSTISLQQSKDRLTTLLRQSEEQAYQLQQEFEQTSQKLRQQHIRDNRQHASEIKRLKQSWAQQLPANC